MTRSRARRVPDALRLGMALSQPGIDPRSWVTSARIDDDPEAVYWDPELGWIADVHFVGGSLDGEGPIPCRVAGDQRGPLAGRFCPLKPDQEVAVLILGGNPEEGPVIVGTLTNQTSQAPLMVAGLPIDPSGAPSVPFTSVSPHDSEIVVGENLAEEHQEVLQQATRRVIETLGPAASLLLGSRLATEPFVKGASYTQAEAAALTALAAAFDTLVGVCTAPPLSPLAGGFQAAAAAIRTFTPSAHLSLKILGE